MRRAHPEQERQQVIVRRFDLQRNYDQRPFRKIFTDYESWRIEKRFPL